MVFRKRMHDEIRKQVSITVFIGPIEEKIREYLPILKIWGRYPMISPRRA
jgi:hypothetical protein